MSWGYHCFRGYHGWFVYSFVVPMASVVTTSGYHVYECSCGYPGYQCFCGFHSWNGYCLVVLMASTVTIYGYQGYRCPVFTIVSVVTIACFLLPCGSRGQNGYHFWLPWLRVFLWLPGLAWLLSCTMGSMVTSVPVVAIVGMATVLFSWLA